MYFEGSELFDDSWQQVMLGQGLMPESYHPIVDRMSKEELSNFLGEIKSNIQRTVAKLPIHKDYIAHYCKAENVN